MSQILSSADELLSNYKMTCMGSKRTPEVHRSCSSWRLQSKRPHRTRTGPWINSYFVGHQFKATPIDSLGCGGRSGGPCNEIHASPYLGASTDTVDTFLLHTLRRYMDHKRKAVKQECCQIFLLNSVGARRSPRREGRILSHH